MTIKETAGKIILYFYQLQRTVPLTMKYRQLGFIDRKNGGLYVTSDKKWLTNNLLDINSVSTDVLNAFTFLIDKGFIHTKERATAEAKIYVGIQLTSTGIDIVEGIEGGPEGKQDFMNTFNIQVDGSANIESVISDNLSILVENNN
ncbi:MAG: hypothetical protein JWO54_231 [Candidatus Saccharibacteria bacterium]|nr:hypothetical protein [Candidatus Saccharibacteria bacterium]MDB5180473.1 hypothetical protein [Candidatus Saccharibacteria bacterium]